MLDVDTPYFGEAIVALADGRVFRGRAFGARRTVVGEVVFNTAMTGYQEIITDPSYAGQLVCLTVAEVGNVGCNEEDRESKAAGAEALIIRSLSPVVSNWRSTATLPEYLEARGVPGIGEVDTRALTRHLRERGATMGAVSTDGTSSQRLVELAAAAPSMEGRALAYEVATAKPYSWSDKSWSASPETVPDAPHRFHVVAYDFGIKENILRCMADVGIRCTVVPPKTAVEDVLALEPDGVFLSNGPGDPAALPEAVQNISRLLRDHVDLPVFGICLGHQLMCLALGGKTFKLKFGHHGGNHPVRHEHSQRVEITSQNHGFAAELESLGEGARLTHLNLFDKTVAGLRMENRPVLGVQYHPEASPGPHDARHLFAEFAHLLAERKQAGTAP